MSRPDRTPDVAIVSPYPPLGVRHGGTSGVASYTRNLAHGLVDHGTDVVVIAPRVEGQPVVGDDDGVRVERSFDLGAAALPAALRAAEDTGADVVHLQLELFLYGGPAALPGLLWALRRADRPVVTTLHQVVDPSDVDEDYTAMHRVSVPATLARHGIDALQQTVARSSSATVVHETRFADLVPHARVIHHGIEQADGPDRDEARRRLGLGDTFTVLCFGFVAPYKGLEHAIDAAHHDRVEDEAAFDLVVAGGTHPRLGAEGDHYRDALERRRGAVARFVGYVPDDDVATWFRAVDVLLLPYPVPHASSGALALALAHDTPVLLSPALGRTVDAPDELVVALQPQAIAARLRRLVADPAARDLLATATRRLADGRDWATAASHHLDIYREVRHADRSDHRLVRTG